MGTTNLGLSIISSSDYISPEPINNNMEKLDALGNDYIVAQGKSGDWWYRKWNSGRAECGVDYKSFGTLGLTTAEYWGGNKITAQQSFGSYPFAFKSRPYTHIEFLYDSQMPDGRGCFVYQYSTTSTTKSPNFVLMDSSSVNGGDSISPYFGIYVNGWWK